MPMYMGQAVSDAYLQGLIDAYREGQQSVGGAVEDGDQVILDRLASQGVTAARAPSAYDLGAADSKTS